ncbi:MAG: hypothetical protein KDM81_07670, partial [Verrucomicrobiae bacterium]|nr:hypothetical protein [Verrucomicrobiae bacterium]
WVGGRIERLGDAASDPAAYVPLFVILAAMILASLGALPWLLKLGSLAAAARPSQPDPTP